MPHDPSKQASAMHLCKVWCTISRLEKFKATCLPSGLSRWARRRRPEPPHGRSWPRWPPCAAEPKSQTRFWWCLCSTNTMCAESHWQKSTKPSQISQPQSWSSVLDIANLLLSSRTWKVNYTQYYFIYNEWESTLTPRASSVVSLCWESGLRRW